MQCLTFLSIDQSSVATSIPCHSTHGDYKQRASFLLALISDTSLHSTRSFMRKILPESVGDNVHRTVSRLTIVNAILNGRTDEENEKVQVSK